MQPMIYRGYDTFDEWCLALDIEAAKRGIKIISKDYLVYSYDDGYTPEMAVKDYIDCDTNQRKFHADNSKRGCFVQGLPIPVKEIDPEKSRQKDKSRGDIFE